MWVALRSMGKWAAGRLLYPDSGRGRVRRLVASAPLPRPPKSTLSGLGFGILVADQATTKEPK